MVAKWSCASNVSPLRHCQLVDGQGKWRWTPRSWQLRSLRSLEGELTQGVCTPWLVWFNCHQLSLHPSILPSGRAQKSADFFDLAASFKSSGALETKLFAKELDLCLCAPPHLAHPPGALRGLITGVTKRICRLAADAADQRSSVIDPLHRPLMRGHQAPDTLPMFKAALVATTKPLSPPVIATGGFEAAPQLFFHLSLHPRDAPSSKVIQAIFHSAFCPKRETPLPGLRNFENGIFRSNCLIGACH